MKYIGHGLFNVNTDILRYDFQRDEFGPGFTQEEMDEAYNLPAFQKDLAIVAERSRAEMRRLGPNWEFSPVNPSVYAV